MRRSDTETEQTSKHLKDVLRRTRLPWLGHVHRMDNNRIPKQAPTWFPQNGKSKHGRPRKSWSDTLSEDLQNIQMAWKDNGEVADDRPL